MELNQDQIQVLVYGLSYLLSSLQRLMGEKGNMSLNDVKGLFDIFTNILELRKMITSTVVKPFIEKTMEEYSKLYIKKSSL